VKPKKFYSDGLVELVNAALKLARKDDADVKRQRERRKKPRVMPKSK